ncbi:MAG: AmmeMemoRadiSam system protein A [Candidatus Competibacteraceae bacterium]|nr:AmmeMemoRadiSam system protein A [Candidatus Competibacteraceae bacterium]MBK7984705.1 AmmeMemoRadiSam system protein A [Candidatus Competibacteraceae bacterium]MBK8899529.1 AmmeMemoRadiSam system protein A [Candidatus Competibacteraceae bacterium]MBK8964532.1 AmmeMemoRadiSam system protein A [Candidatus Competibacteraceae bacterium]MBK9952526.1 AmmeMemoRadiSam system protein A [Candidatus Competibacteraceae bacterium]
MLSIDALSRQNRATLLEVARTSIRHGLEHGQALAVNPDDYPEALRPTRATFVTLETEGQLRGCIGTLAAHQPLVRDVAEHAHAAAFDDPRFPELTAKEFPRLDIHISVLSPPEPLQFESEDELLAQLRPGVDGLILQFRSHRATFLPAVWESLPAPYVFLAQLKQKAGLPLNFWSPDLRAERYTTEYFGDADVAGGTR